MRKYRILLVDDEELAIRGIERGIDWDKLNIERVYKAHNKSTAIRMLSTYPIDIIITDVEMPNGNGLELIRWVIENRKETINIFYTGHAEFAYAQEAIRLGVQDYLLKPIPYQELEEIVARAEEKLSGKEDNRLMAEVWKELSKEETVSTVASVKKFILQNIDQELQRDALAAMVHITPNYLSKIFKKEEGISLSDYILDKRIAVAKQLLQKTNLPITIIAGKVGI